MRTVPMRKFLAAIFVALFFLTFVIFPIMAGAETMEAAPMGESGAAMTSAEVIAAETSQEAPVAPWTWQYLASIAGATAAVLLITQFLKVPMDKVWKIPTRLFVYLLSLVIMTVATAFTTGITVESFLLSALNAFIVALTAYGSYEVTFANRDRP